MLPISDDDCTLGETNADPFHSDTIRFMIVRQAVLDDPKTQGGSLRRTSQDCRKYKKYLVSFSLRLPHCNRVTTIKKRAFLSLKYLLSLYECGNRPEGLAGLSNVYLAK